MVAHRVPKRGGVVANHAIPVRRVNIRAAKGNRSARNDRRVQNHRRRNPVRFRRSHANQDNGMITKAAVAAAAGVEAVIDSSRVTRSMHRTAPTQFRTVPILRFPQPAYPSTWRLALSLTLPQRWSRHLHPSRPRRRLWRQSGKCTASNQRRRQASRPRLPTSLRPNIGTCRR
jgi:hypothetical protein